MTREPPDPDPSPDDDADVDEVDVPVGPDRDALGLFDAGTTTGTATREHTGGAGDGPDRGGEQRTAVLAWLAAQEPPPPVEDGPLAPCAPLKRLIADEPLDPLPALDGVPLRRARGSRPGGRTFDELAPEREDTATQIEGFEAAIERRSGAEPPSEVTPVAPTAGRLAVSPRAMLIVALVALVVAWVLLRVG